MKQEELEQWKLEHKVATMHLIQSGLRVEFNSKETLMLSQVVMKYPISAIIQALNEPGEQDDELEGFEDHLKYLHAKGEIPSLIDIVEKV